MGYREANPFCEAVELGPRRAARGTPRGTPNPTNIEATASQGARSRVAGGRADARTPGAAGGLAQPPYYSDGGAGSLPPQHREWWAGPLRFYARDPDMRAAMDARSLSRQSHQVAHGNELQPPPLNRLRSTPSPAEPPSPFQLPPPVPMAAPASHLRMLHREGPTESHKAAHHAPPSAPVGLLFSFFVLCLVSPLLGERPSRPKPCTPSPSLSTLSTTTRWRRA